MNPAQITTMMAALIKQSGHPDITSVEALDTYSVKVVCEDGSTNYLKVAHIQPANAPTPAKPSWPRPDVQATGGRK